MKLVEGTRVFNTWLNPPVPLYMNIHIFNISIPNDRIENVVLEDLGPYVYRIKLKKYITNWGKDNETLTFDEKISFHFEEKLSKGKETDEIYIIDLPAVVIGQVVDKNYADLASFIEKLLKSYDVTLFKKMQVRQLLFEGYKVDFLEELADFDDSVNDILPNFTFGLFYNKNNSITKNITMNTGINDKNSFGIIVSIANKTKVDIWSHDYCNMINGSDGVAHPQPINQDMKLQFFVHLLQRSFTLEYVRDTEIQRIPAMEFTVTPDTFDTQGKSSDYHCFCDTKWCDYKGVFSYKAIEAASVLISMPHFVGADPKFSIFKGLDQDKEKYKIFFKIQPAIGFTLELAFTLQFNIIIKHSENFWYLRKLNETVFPIAWFSQTAELPEDFAKELYDMIMMPQMYGKYAIMTIIGLGIIGISAALFSNLYPMWKKRKSPTPSGKVFPMNKNSKTLEIEKF